MTTSSSTDSTDRVEAVEADDAETELLVDAVPSDEIVPELVEGADDLPAYDDKPGSGGVIAAGAAAVAAAGLAITSLGGNWLGDVLSQRQSLIGQINTANAAADAIIKQRYTDVWHKQAFVSMGFAIAAVVIAAATLFLGAFAAKQQPPVWVRVLVWGALALGVIGIGISAAMYFDVFTGTISVPAGAASGGQ
ncbi:hypothetical protein ABH926_002354 [Catenulispora sp. GP43]|uniref:hypothetical protein n=1 Tax=Catenulispora sp. GP43 TaxID=3156263 RepID=UPI003514E764